MTEPEGKGPGISGAGHDALNLDLRFDGTESAVARALDRIGKALAADGVAPGDADTTRIVIAEVCNNIVEHAYGPDLRGDIGVHVTRTPTGVSCTIRDTGCALPPGPLPGRGFPPVDPVDLDGLPEGGFGWALVRRLARDVLYERQSGENVLSFVIPAD